MRSATPAVIVLSLAPAVAAAERPLTCDPDQIDARSYRLTTQVQGQIVVHQDYSFWEAFKVGRHEEVLGDINDAETRAAERAIGLDPGNRMAHAILARQYLILDDPEAAEPEWAQVMEAGGAVAWTGTLYDVDARSFFFVAFDREGLRIYRFGAVVGASFHKGFGGLPEWPDPGNERFWAAEGGCFDRAIAPEAVVPWSQVKEIKAGNWVLWFKLTRPITVSSDRDKRKTIDEIKVNLHGRSGEMEVYKPVGEHRLAMRSRGPAGYQDNVRRTLVKFVDPERRIALPPVKPGVGW
jgi:hypothetical protein